MVLVDIERSGATIHGEKSCLYKFYIEGVKIMGFVYNARGRSPGSPKIAKVLG